MLPKQIPMLGMLRCLSGRHQAAQVHPNTLARNLGAKMLPRLQRVPTDWHLRIVTVPCPSFPSRVLDSRPDGGHELTQSPLLQSLDNKVTSLAADSRESRHGDTKL
ncbi:hypothetical protein E4U54_005760 [Claviceps lovelessii]|nr:hypothetical protein E4U54_005760 [Claviceps lovelessii]